MDNARAGRAKQDFSCFCCWDFLKENFHVDQNPGWLSYIRGILLPSYKGLQWAIGCVWHVPFRSWPRVAQTWGAAQWAWPAPEAGGQAGGRPWCPQRWWEGMDSNKYTTHPWIGVRFSSLFILSKAHKAHNLFFWWKFLAARTMPVPCCGPAGWSFCPVWPTLP